MSLTVPLSREYRVAGVALCSESCNGVQDNDCNCNCMLVNDKKQGLAYRNGLLMENGPWAKRLDTLRKVHAKKQCDLLQLRKPGSQGKQQESLEQVEGCTSTDEVAKITAESSLPKARREAKQAEQRLIEFLAHLKTYDIKIDSDTISDA